MKLSLPDSVLSQEDLRALTMEVAEYARWFSQTAVKQRVAGGQAGQTPELSAGATRLINDWSKEKKLSRDSLDELISLLNRLEETSPSLTITLAAPPAGQLKKTLVAWCRQNVHPNLLVNFRFNSTLLGGMVISFGSHIYDWSFRRQVLAARDKFPEVLRNV